MASFEQLFPSFLRKCAELHDLLLSVAFLLLVVGLLLTVSHRFTARTLGLYLVRLLVLMSLLVFLPRWGNQLQSLLQSSILDGLGVDPVAVADHYNQLLVVQRDSSTAHSWWNLLSDASGFTVEVLVSAVLWLIGHAASLLLFWAYLIQKVILHMGYALSPLLIGFMAIHSLRWIGNKYLMNLVGVLLWPLGWAVSSLITQGILDFTTDPTLKYLDPLSKGYTLQATLGVALIAFWILFSTVAAPILLQHVLSQGALLGSELIGAGVGSLIQTASSTMGATAALAPIAHPAATATAAGVAGVLGTLSTAAHLPSVGGILSAGIGLPARRGSRGSGPDLSGDQRVRQILHKHRNPPL